MVSDEFVPLAVHNLDHLRFRRVGSALLLETSSAQPLAAALFTGKGSMTSVLQRALKPGVRVWWNGMLCAVGLYQSTTGRVVSSDMMWDSTSVGKKLFDRGVVTVSVTSDGLLVGDVLAASAADGRVSWRQFTRHLESGFSRPRDGS